MSLTIISVEDLKWAREDHSCIDLLVQFEQFSEKTPYTATPEDDTEHGIELWSKANAGDYGEIVEYVVPAPIVPEEISPAQLFLQLNALGFITTQEALDAATAGKVPAAIDAIFSTLPANEALAARVRWARMTTCLRSDPLVAGLALANNLSEEDIDQFFIDAAKL